jgi:hypothetical protein
MWAIGTRGGNEVKGLEMRIIRVFRVLGGIGGFLI